MHLGVRGHLDVEVPPRFFADEGHQVAGVLKLAARAIAAGQVAPQSHQPPHAHAPLSTASCSRTDWRVAPMHEKWEAALTPSERISFTVVKVPSCVEPPAP